VSKLCARPIFNVEVFNKTISGNASPPEYFTGQEFYALLGSADSFAAQVIVDAVETSNTQVTVVYQTTNTAEEETWMVGKVSGGSSPIQVSVTTVNKTDPPQQGVLIVPATDPTFVNGAFGRLLVTSDTPGASVRIIACGRTC